jgi:hypothetical protein
MKLLFCLLFLLSCDFIIAQDWVDTSFVVCYKGKADGQYSVTMELSIKGKQCTGRYFYDKYRKDIRFEGQLELDNRIVLQELGEKGNKIENYFEGKYSQDWSQLDGNWSEANKEKNYSLALEAIYQPEGRKEVALDFDKIRLFQGMLNYFDLEAGLPWRIPKSIKKTKFRWKRGMDKKSLADFDSFLPYMLVNRFILQQVRMSSIAPLNFWKMKPQEYDSAEKSYRAICKLIHTKSYVGLLIQLDVDNAWHQYDIAFLVIYNYEGVVLDAIPISKEIAWDRGTNYYQEEQMAAIAADYTIVTENTLKQQKIVTDKRGIEVLKKEENETEIHYILEPSTGRFFRQVVSE